MLACVVFHICKNVNRANKCMFVINKKCFSFHLLYVERYMNDKEEASKFTLSRVPFVSRRGAEI